MVDDEKVILHSNDAFAVEVRGFDHIPEAERNMTLRQVDHFWVGNSVNLLSFTLGALAIAEGLSLPWALIACIVGSILYAYVGLASIVAVRAGLPTSTLTRAAFGMRGNLPQATLCWAAGLAYEVINIIFGVEAFAGIVRTARLGASRCHRQIGGHGTPTHALRRNRRTGPRHHDLVRARVRRGRDPCPRRGVPVRHRSTAWEQRGWRRTSRCRPAPPWQHS